jgi:hypothetical protein
VNLRLRRSCRLVCREALHRLVADSAGDHARRDDGRGLPDQTRPDSRASADRTASANEAGKRRRKLHGAEALERRHARALLALESRALGALAEMGAERAPLGR